MHEHSRNVVDRERSERRCAGPESPGALPTIDQNAEAGGDIWMNAWPTDIADAFSDGSERRRASRVNPLAYKAIDPGGGIAFYSDTEPAGKSGAG